MYKKAEIMGLLLLCVPLQNCVIMAHSFTCSYECKSAESVHLLDVFQRPRTRVKCAVEVMGFALPLSLVVPLFTCARANPAPSASVTGLWVHCLSVFWQWSFIRLNRVFFSLADKCCNVVRSRVNAWSKSKMSSNVYGTLLTNWTSTHLVGDYNTGWI